MSVDEGINLMKESSSSIEVLDGLFLEGTEDLEIGLDMRIVVELEIGV